MKYFLFCLLSMVTLLSQAQLKPVAHKNEPAYFIDSVQYKKVPIIDPNSIESLNVVKDKVGKYPNGVIYFNLKAEATYNLVTLETVAQQQLGTAKKPYMMMVDNEFITDMTDVLIDSSFILNREVISSRDFVHLQHMPEIIIVKLTTATKENKEKAARIRIRG